MQNNCFKYKELTRPISVFRDWARTFFLHLALNTSVNPLSFPILSDIFNFIQVLIAGRFQSICVSVCPLPVLVFLMMHFYHLL